MEWRKHPSNDVMLPINVPSWALVVEKVPFLEVEPLKTPFNEWNLCVENIISQKAEKISNQDDKGKEEANQTESKEEEANQVESKEELARKEVSCVTFTLSPTSLSSAPITIEDIVENDENQENQHAFGLTTSTIESEEKEPQKPPDITVFTEKEAEQKADIHVRKQSTYFVFPIRPY